MFAQGTDLICSIVNTARCSDSGQHWVAFVISHKSRTVEIFDSTGEYREELKPVLAFATFIADQCSLTMGVPYTVMHLDSEVQ